MGTSFKWVESLPPRIGGTATLTKSQRIARVLKANPGRWAQVGAFQKQREVRSLEGSLRNLGLQVSVRKANGGWTRVYARYNSAVPASKKAKK